MHYHNTEITEITSRQQVEESGSPTPWTHCASLISKVNGGVYTEKCSLGMVTD